MKELIRNRSFLLVWMAQAASGLGGMFAMFIEAWLVYSITGSELAMGGLVMAFMTASLTVQLGGAVFGPLGSAPCDGVFPVGPGRGISGSCRNVCFGRPVVVVFISGGADRRSR